MKLIDILSEIVTREKKRLGSGYYHFIYPHPTNPDLVYKVDYNNVIINNWVPVFKAHPELFPEVYGDIKKTMMTFNLHFGEKKRQEVSYILVERLDTKTFGDFIKELYKINIDLGISPYGALINVYLKGRYSDEVMRFLDNVKRKAPHTYDKCIELFDLAVKIWEVVPDWDMHMNQFGYDKTGKLKCLDI